MRVLAVRCNLVACKFSARQTLLAEEFGVASLAVYDCIRGLLLLIAREALIRYAEKSWLAGQWSGV